MANYSDTAALVDNDGANEKLRPGLPDLDVEEPMSGCGYVFCHPRSTTHRYIVLFFMCMLTFGSYYCYDGPTALETTIEEDMNVSPTSYNLLFSFYSWPNTILCFVGGYLLDRLFGIRLGAVIFAGIICVGQVVFALGGIFDMFWLMCLGRFIFGIGGESLAVAQNAYAVLWYKGKELNTVFGLQLSVSRLGSVGAMKTMPLLYNATSTPDAEGHTTLGFTLLIAAGAAVFSFLSALIMMWFDRRNERITKRNENETTEQVLISDVLYFPASFWLLTVLCVCYYVAVFPLIGNSVEFMEKQYNMTNNEASWIAILPYTISAVASPIFGIICDLTGMNLAWSLLAVIITFFCHATFCFTNLKPIIPMSVLGVTIAMFASAFWPMCAFVIPKHQLGTAYGTMQAVQNLGLAIAFPLAGVVIEKLHYTGMSIFFMGWLSCGVAVAIGLTLLNIARKGNLNPPLYRERLSCCRPADTGIASFNPIMEVST